MGQQTSQIKEELFAFLRTQHPNVCRHWFDEIEPLEVSNGTLKLLVRETVQLKYLRRCCVDQFTEAAQSVTGRLLVVSFVGEDDVDNSVNETLFENLPPVVPNEPFSPLTIDNEMLISPDYSFDNFVIGPGNRLAHAAAYAVAQKPGKAYNPLFIHGGVGLGKTHLLQAICQLAMAHRPDLQIYYISCDGFMTHFLEAVQAGQMMDFRHRFRNVDLLVIDDIHDLSKRNRTQEEFFHTFNSLYQSGRQIVLSSDAAPDEIPDLEERLISRFSCGLVAQIERPCYETRVAIVKQKAFVQQIDLPDDVSSYIAAKIDTNIRELEGALIKVHGLAHVNAVPISLALAKEAIGDRSNRSRSQHPSIQSIIDAITSYYDVKLTDLLSKRRQKSIALPRQIGMWLARKHTRYSLEEIGGYFGGRDHTTVMHAIRAINTKRKGDSSLDQDLSHLEEQLSSQSTNSSTETT
ncbi:MAG: chromosomal replication initiator protein DnaA [Phycisphaerales bacterium]|nr:chromosomal replication initiator protein DnaA [Phycisphaerales bacterium]